MKKQIEFDRWKSFKEYEQDGYWKFSEKEEDIGISLAGGKFVCVQFEKKTGDINGNSVYKISYDLDVMGEKAWVRVMHGWYDGNGNALVKGYLSGNDKIVAPEDAEFLKISVNIHSSFKAECNFSNLMVECLGEYKPHNVTLSTVALKYPVYPAKKDCRDNLKETLKKIDELCINEKPDLIVLTEAFYTMKCQIPTREASLPEDSEPVMRIREKAKQYNTHIVFSFRELENGQHYNTGFLIDRKGNIAGKYRKTHLTMSELENGLTPGEEIKVFDTDIGKIGIAICWDIFFPELVRKMQKLGVDIICNPTAGYRESRIFERARDCGAYVIVSTVTDFKDSAVFGPDGEKLCNASEHNGYGAVTVDINKPYYVYWQSYPAKTCARDVYLNEARWELYV